MGTEKPFCSGAAKLAVFHLQTMNPQKRSNNKKASQTDSAVTDTGWRELCLGNNPSIVLQPEFVI